MAEYGGWVMFRFKACQRCQGDLHVEQNELDGTEARCIQCGYRSFGTAVPPW